MEFNKAICSLVSKRQKSFLSAGGRWYQQYPKSSIEANTMGSKVLLAGNARIKEKKHTRCLATINLLQRLNLPFGPRWAERDFFVSLAACLIIAFSVVATFFFKFLIVRWSAVRVLVWRRTFFWSFFFDRDLALRYRGGVRFELFLDGAFFLMGIV